MVASDPWTAVSNLLALISREYTQLVWHHLLYMPKVHQYLFKSSPNTCHTMGNKARHGQG